MLRRVYIAFIRSKIEYGSVIFGDLTNKNKQILEVLQNKCLRTILGARKTSPILSMQMEAYVPPITLRFKYLQLKWFIKLKLRDRNDYTVEELCINERGLHQQEFVREAMKATNELQLPIIRPTPTPIISPCLLYTSPSPRDKRQSRMPSSA